ncbi:mediator complex, subunit Med17 [Lipomyces arxii]|uniref:mediator complex, subunit Med17 n=1 Tax=Lipomyces arxii TaxID=56418 RepID=UPI0034D01FE2
MSTPMVIDGEIWLSLEPPPLVADPTKSIKSHRNLGQVIPQIALERGSFANVKEESLRKEIEDQKNQQTDEETNSPTDNSIKPDVAPASKADLSSHEQEFNVNRTELSRLISAAQNEAAIALDFVSLLISSVRPAAGTTSMSPHLQSHVPVGSLGADRMKPLLPVEDTSVCVGWKEEAVGASVKRLADAATRLQDESQREKVYWRQIEDISLSGELLLRLRISDYRGLAVRYGFGDAGSKYKEGIATLRRDAEGKIILKMEGDRSTNVLTITVLREVGSEYVETAQYYPRLWDNDADVKAQIRLARNLLFEEELFFLSAHETRLLASQGITLDFGNKITIPLTGMQIVLEMAEATKHHDAMDVEERSDDNIVAEAVWVALHLLLSKLHRSNLQSSREIPQPLGTKKVGIEASNILEPLVTALHTQPVQSGLKSLLSELAAFFQN